jgi:hypothetical protein
MKVSGTELLMTKMLAKVTSFTAEDLSLNLRIYRPRQREDEDVEGAEDRNRPIGNRRSSGDRMKR